MINRALFTIVVVFMTFSFGFSQAKNQEQSEIPTVSFCELTNNPEKYADKIIRTEESYIVWWESSYLYSETCIDNKQKIHNVTDCEATDEKCLKDFSAEWKKLEPYMRSKKSKYQTTFRVKAVFVGRFVGPGTYGHLGSFEYEFRVQKVEKVTAIPKSVSWNGL